MRFPRFTAALAVFAILPGIAKAEFLGGRAEVSHSMFVNDGSLAKSTAGVQLEWGFGPGFVTQTDLSLSGLHALDDTALNITTHLGWSFGEMGTASLFYGWDKVVGSEDFYGLEYARALGGTEVEGFVAIIDEPGSNGTMAGLSGRMAMNDRVGLGASVDYMSSDNLADGTRIGLNGDYTLGASTRLRGELGRVNADDNAGNSVNETYVKLGVDFRFGQKGGTSFGTRSLFNFLPGM